MVLRQGGGVRKGEQQHTSPAPLAAPHTSLTLPLVQLPAQEGPAALGPPAGPRSQLCGETASVQWPLPTRGKHLKPELCWAWQDTCPLIGGDRTSKASVYAYTAPAGQRGSCGAAGSGRPEHPWEGRALGAAGPSGPSPAREGDDEFSVPFSRKEGFLVGRWVAFSCHTRVAVCPISPGQSCLHPPAWCNY